jgi:hypothetical protein
MPTTEAGKKLLSDILSLVKQVAGYNHPVNDEAWAEAVTAVEKEAVDNEIKATMERFKDPRFAGDTDPWNHGDAI